MTTKILIVYFKIEEWRRATVDYISESRFSFEKREKEKESKREKTPFLLKVRRCILT